MYWLSWEPLCESIFLCILRVALGPRVKLTSCKSALTPRWFIDRSKAVAPVLVLLFVALWFILRGDLLNILPCVILFLCFLVLLALRLPRLGKRALALVLFVRLFDVCSFGFLGFLFLLVSGKCCGMWLWHSLDFSLTFFLHTVGFCKPILLSWQSSFCKQQHFAKEWIVKWIIKQLRFRSQFPEFSTCQKKSGSSKT